MSSSVASCRVRIAAPLLAALTVLAACSDEDPLLAGPREDVRAVVGPAVLAAAATDVSPAPIALPPARTLADWPLRVGTAANDPGHATLAAAPARVWTADIGRGDDRRHRIASDPVSDGARVFAFDARARLSATSLSGGTVWARSLVPSSDRSGDAVGGGIAVAGGAVFAATGFGELHALDATTGATRWVQALDAPLTAPKPVGGLVYVVSRDGRAWAIDAANGRVRWEVSTPAGTPVSVTGPAPAVTGGVAILPFGSGEIVAVRPDTGERVWGAGVSGQRRGVAYNDLGDVTGDPVASNGVVFAGTTAGRIVALDAVSGERRWTATDGAVSPMAVAGGSVFAVTDRAQLVRLDAATGATVWRADLPQFPARRLARRDAVYAHYGPVLAGGRLWVASSDGALRGFDPEGGSLVVSLAIPGGAASRPIALRDALFVIDRRGRLNAFR